MCFILKCLVLYGIALLHSRWTLDGLSLTHTNGTDRDLHQDYRYPLNHIQTYVFVDSNVEPIRSTDARLSTLCPIHSDHKNDAPPPKLPSFASTRLDQEEEFLATFSLLHIFSLESHNFGFSSQLLATDRTITNDLNFQP